MHCGEGKGRTGTVLAAYLVFNGIPADEAIRLVRDKRPESVQNLPGQENVIRKFESRKKGKRQVIWQSDIGGSETPLILRSQTE